MQVDGWLSVEQAAQALGVTVRAVYGLVKAGHLADYTIGKMRVVWAEDVEDYLTKQAGKSRRGPKPARQGEAGA